MVEIKRILIIRLSAMGDLILATPMLHWVGSRFPNAIIDVVAKEAFAPILRGHPDADEVLMLPQEATLKDLICLCLKIRSRKYDAVIDLQANFRSRIMVWLSGAGTRILYHPERWKRFWLTFPGKNLYREILPVPLRYLKAAESLGLSDDGKGACIFPGEEDQASVNQKLNYLDRKNILVLAPGAAHFTKRWPARFYGEVGRFFSASGTGIVLTGGKADTGICREIEDIVQSGCLNLCGQLRLMETAALIKEAGIVLTNDTGVMHMAGAVGSRVVAIFGPTTRHFGFFPFRSKSIVVEHPDLDCRPCSYHGSSGCPKKHFRCMQELVPDQIISAVKQILSN